MGYLKSDKKLLIYFLNCCYISKYGGGGSMLNSNMTEVFAPGNNDTVTNALKQNDLNKYTLKEILENKKQIKGSQLRRTLHKKQRFKSIYSLDSSKIKKVVSILAKNKTWQVPTLRLYKNYVYQKYKDSSYTSYFKMLPKNKKEEWISEIKKIPRNLNMDLKNYSDWTQIMVKYMNLNGIKFMAGTDVPIGYLLPGLSLHQELIELNNSGLSNREVIQSATINPAKYFNMNDSLGKVKIGYIADVIILDNNPLEKIENTLSINAVIKDGKYLGRKYLDSLLYHNKDDQYFPKLISK